MKSGKLFVFLLLLVIAGGGFFSWTEIESKRTLIEELELKNSQLTQLTQTLKQQAAAAEAAKGETVAQLQEFQKANCKGTWSPENGCQEPPKVFSYPVGEESFCFGKAVEVKWDPSLVNSEKVDLMLATSSNAAKLASLKNEGTYRWKLESLHKTLGSDGSFTIAAGLYKMRIQSPDGILLGKDTELFDIKKCDAKKPKPAARKKK